jgi:hypothetical protein
MSSENEQDGAPEQGAAEDHPGGWKGAEKLTRDELGRVARSDAAAGHPEYDVEGRYNREAEALGRLKARYPWLVLEPNPDRQIGGGAEHLVEQASDPSRVLKHSRDGEQSPRRRKLSRHIDFAPRNSIRVCAQDGCTECNI